MKVKKKALLGQLSDTDFRLLQVYQAVVNCGGFSAAELELNIGMSTISRHIKDLETRLGLVLCQRGRSGFALTSEGKQVYAEACKLFGALEQFRTGIDDIHGRLGGELKIAVFEKTTSNPNAKIPRAISTFVHAAPDVSLSLHVRPINEIERAVIDGSYDLGIIPGHRDSQCLQYTPLFTEDMQLYCSTDHPLSAVTHQSLEWDEVSGHPLAGLAYHSPNLQTTHKAGLTRTAHAYDQEGVATFILSGKFIGFLPSHYAHYFEIMGQLVAISPQTLNYQATYFAITRHSPPPCRATKMFIDCLIDAHQ
ncbi:LysR family transcriptional regulator [Orrella daihaiensis]|uniref:LysR family transcriptional regulator n=1 Tax=Orrella daihaiensis TaxID=2782176 RepID=A0ABY4ALG4_9BURK|nr:LysR family transcriptional regulator [Orrella daihaiensis]UOD50888.1 LysR family transcriptional regulator [Orrella daihaiensis]